MIGTGPKVLVSFRWESRVGHLMEIVTSALFAQLCPPSKVDQKSPENPIGALVG
jgi:hypothetical protein